MGGGMNDKGPHFETVSPNLLRKKLHANKYL